MGLIEAFMKGYNGNKNITPEEKERNQQIIREMEEYRRTHPKPVDPNIPRCPVCRSPEIQKIGAGKRMVHGAAFGLFSKTARSQWECKHCGNKW